MREPNGRSPVAGADHAGPSEVSASRPRRRLPSRLGELLVEARAITAAQLESALEEQKVTGSRLGDVLLQRRHVSERQLFTALAKQLGIRFVDLDALTLDGRLAAPIDADHARRHRVIAIATTAGGLTVAMEDPTDRDTVEALAKVTGRRIEVAVGTPAAFWRAYGRIYGDRVVAAAEQQASDLAAKHVETVQRLAAVRAASQHVREALDAGSRLLRDTRAPA